MIYYSAEIHAPRAGSFKGMKPGILLLVAASHAIALVLFLQMAPQPVRNHSVVIPAKPLQVVIVEPIEAPLVKESGGPKIHPGMQPAVQPQDHSEISTPEIAAKVSRQMPAEPVQTKAATPNQSIPALAKTASSAQTSIASTNSSEHRITAPTPSSSSGGTEKSAPAPAVASASPGAAPAPSGTGDNSPPRFGVAYLNNPAPKYPAIARRMGEEGRVLLRVLVTAAGAAKQVKLSASSGSGVLDEAAEKAVRDWKFVPAKQDGQAVEAWVQVPIVFKLD